MEQELAINTRRCYGFITSIQIGAMEQLWITNSFLNWSPKILIWEEKRNNSMISQETSWVKKLEKKYHTSIFNPKKWQVVLFTNANISVSSVSHSPQNFKFSQCIFKAKIVLSIFGFLSYETPNSEVEINERKNRKPLLILKRLKKL